MEILRGILGSAPRKSRPLGAALSILYDHAIMCLFCLVFAEYALSRSRSYRRCALYLTGCTLVSVACARVVCCTCFTCGQSNSCSGDAKSCCKFFHCNLFIFSMLKPRKTMLHKFEQSLSSLSLYTNENALHTVFQEFF